MRCVHFCAYRGAASDNAASPASSPGRRPAAEFYREDWHDPAAMFAALGATTVALMHNSGADPRAAIGVCAEGALPRLRGG